MPEPTGIREQQRASIRLELARARPRLMDAARTADEARVETLHARLMALVADLDEIADEVDGG